MKKQGSLRTIWVFGDQLNMEIGALKGASPQTHRVLMIESSSKIASFPWHVQRAHFIVSSMRRFAEDLRSHGFQVDYRKAASMREGLSEHRKEYSPESVVATEPNSFAARRLVNSLGVECTRSNQFLCHPSDFHEFVGARKSLKMEDFYRWQRRRYGYLMVGDEPVGARWNYDEDNRQPPPKTGHDRWPVPRLQALDNTDIDVLRELPNSVWGKQPDGLWATTRVGALERLDYFVREILPSFGDHEDAMLSANWHLAHSLLSPYLNIGLLLPKEVLDAAVGAYEAGDVPINSVEGYVRQILGWREYIWNCYWRWMPRYAQLNELNAQRPLPELFTNPQATSMKCMSSVLSGIYERSYAHHIERLMVLGNFALIAGINPQEFTRWMWNSFIDAAEWVMVPNVIGMSLYADGGMLATKPYASGGAYIDKMSDHCKGCRYDRKQRVGADACPFTVLYWDFQLRHEARFVKNPRVARQVRGAQQLSNVDEVRETAQRMLHDLDNGLL